MLLASPRPHGCISTDGLGVGIEVRAMDRMCRITVRADPAMDSGVGVRLKRVIRAVGDGGCRLPLLGQSIGPQQAYFLPKVCAFLQKNKKMIRGYAHTTIRIN